MIAGAPLWACTVLSTIGLAALVLGIAKLITRAGREVKR